jgi:hypothetical protein
MRVAQRVETESSWMMRREGSEQSGSRLGGLAVRREQTNGLAMCTPRPT